MDNNQFDNTTGMNDGYTTQQPGAYPPPGGYPQPGYPQQGGYYPQQQTMGVRCPNCGSNNLQVLQEQHTEGKDFKGGKACCGALLFGPLGILCGSCGKGKQLQTNHFWLCNNCGFKFKI